MEYWNIPEKVFDLMKQGLYRTKLSGTCQIELVDDETNIQFSVILSNGSLFYTEQPKGKPDVYIRMKPKVMTGIPDGIIGGYGTWRSGTGQFPLQLIEAPLKTGSTLAGAD
jgi:hypothetical protein